MSPGEGGSRGCLILYDNNWETEEKFVSSDGRLVCVAIKSELISAIVFNMYAPNDHDLQSFESLFEKIVYFKDKFPEFEFIMAGDFNLVLDPEEDSIKRIDSAREKISRNLLKENLRVLEISNAYRKCERTGGYTWSRGGTFSRLDYVFLSNTIIGEVARVECDWTLDKSDHAAVKVLLKFPDSVRKGPGLVRVDASILKNNNAKLEILGRIHGAIDDIPPEWDPNKKLEYLKVIIRSVFGEIGGKYKKIENVEYKATCDNLTN